MKVYAYYLPQFHIVPENEKWWGKGFTEWTSAKNAKALYEGHKQPRVPLNNNYYNLLDKKTMEWQADLMHKYMIDGFCFYHYWFSSEERVLEKPAENLLEWKDINMPFFFSWANESWLNKWSNREGFPWVSNENEKKRELSFIFYQKYGREDEWEKHFDYLIPFFKDSRYIKQDNKPLFAIHCLDNIPCLYEMLDLWNQRARQNGFDGIYVIGVGSKYMDYGVDLVMTHEPGNVYPLLKSENKGDVLSIYSYDEAYEAILKQKYVRGKNYIYTAFSDYDTTPRYGNDGKVFEGATPGKFTYYLARLMAKNYAAGIDMVFIDAWNEWGEGMYLEPDVQNGYGWLESICDAKKQFEKYIPDYSSDDKFLVDSEYRLNCNSQKMKMNLNALNTWMDLREHNISIADWLKSNNIESVAVYGAGLLAKHFIWESDLAGISIAGVIDKSNEKKFQNVAMLDLTGDLAGVDAIVVTAIYYMNEICESIRKYHPNIQIYSLLELLTFAEERL